MLCTPLVWSLAIGCSTSSPPLAGDAGVEDGGQDPRRGDGAIVGVGGLTVSPARLTFGLQPVGVTCAAQTVELRNDGATPLRIEHIAVDPPFAIVDSPAAIELPPQGTREIAVALTAADAQLVDGRLSLQVGDGPARPWVALRGRGMVTDDGVGNLLPSVLDFGEVAVGSSRTVRVLDTSCNGPAGEAEAMPPPPGFSVQPAGKRAFASTGALAYDVTFSPDRAGPFTFGLLIESVVPGFRAIQELNVVGVGKGDVPAPLTVSPSSLQFGDQTAGTPSAPRTVRLENHGASAVAIKSVDLPSGKFQLGSLPTTIPAGGTAEIEVRYAPSGPAPFGNTSVLTIESDATPSEVRVPVAGAGVERARVANLAPAWIDFGAVASGERSAPRRLTIDNGGSEPLVLASASVAAPFVLLEPPEAPLTLAPGEAYTLELVFEPSSPGQVGTDLMLDIGGEQRRMWISGIATRPATGGRDS